MNRIVKSRIVGCFLVIVGTSCTREEPSTASLRPMTRSETREDLNDLATRIRARYAFLEFKEKNAGFDIQEAVKHSQNLLDDAQDDAAVLGVYKKFLRGLKDAHVSLSMNQSPQASTYQSIPLTLFGIEDRVFIAAVDQAIGENCDVRPGDEIIAIDSQKVSDLIPIIQSYETFGNPWSDQQLVTYLLNRPSYMSEIRPQAAEASLTIVRQGQVSDVRLSWKKTRVNSSLPTGAGITGFAQSLDANRLLALAGDDGKKAAQRPFFVSARSIEGLNFHRLELTEDQRHSFDTSPEAVNSIYASQFQHQGKSILLLRQPTFDAPDAFQRINAYRAFLQTYANSSDVLLLDLTRNPGGSIDYAEEFFRLFISSKARGTQFMLHADRAWLAYFDNSIGDGSSEGDPFLAVMQKARDAVEHAYDQQNALSQPVGLGNQTMLDPDPLFVWQKPMVVVIDSMTASSGEVFSLLMQKNQRAPLFGQRTMGAGGIVFADGSLPHSLASLTLTRGAFTVAPEALPDLQQLIIENRGVVPDRMQPLKSTDAVDGFSSYFRAMADFAIQQTATFARETPQ